MTDTIPAADIGLPIADLPNVFPRFSPRPAPVPFDLEDFAADDSGAMEHSLPHDAYEELLAAFLALISSLSVSAKLRTAGGEHA